MENIELNLEEFYFILKEMADAEGAYSREEWDGMVEELLEEKREAGEISDDDDWEVMRDNLRSRFEEFEGTIPEM